MIVSCAQSFILYWTLSSWMSKNMCKFCGRILIFHPNNLFCISLALALALALDLALALAYSYSYLI